METSKASLTPGKRRVKSVDLASGFTQLEISEEDKHKTAFGDAHGTLWELNRWGFGLKTAGFVVFVGGALGSQKGKGAQLWLDDIIIFTQQVEEHLDLLRQVLENLSRAGLSVHFFQVMCTVLSNSL